MEKIIDYVAIKAISTEDLTPWVNLKLKEGYRLYGGIAAASVTADDKGNPSNLVVVCQAMVKYQE